MNVRRTCVGNIAVMLVLTLAAAVLPSAAQAQTTGGQAGGSVDTVTMIGEPGGWVLAGGQLLFRSDRDVVDVSGDPAGQVDVRVESRTSNDYFNLVFAAPRGETLQVGGYAGARRTSFRQAGAPGIDIGGSGRGCNETSGQFTVLDIAPDLSRLWLVYEQYCDGGPALYGEVRIGIDDPDHTGLVVAPTRIDWPAEYPGASGRPVAARLFNITDRPIAVEQATVVEGSDHFSLLSNSCEVVDPGDSCAVYVGFRPAATGLLSGLLRLSDETGRVHDVPLRGSGIAGNTSWDMVSDEGDYIGQGATYDYDSRTASITASGDEEAVRLAVDGTWTLRLGSGPGRLLLPGQTFVTDDGRDGLVDPQIDLSGSGRGCNQTTGRFTVREAAYDDRGRVKRFAVTFTQHCEGMTPALRGSVAWMARDAAAPVPTKDDEQVDLTVRPARGAVAGRSTPITVTAVGATPGEEVTVYARPQGWAERTLGTRRVRDDGTVAPLSYAALRHSRIRAVYQPNGAAVQASATMRVAARVTTTLRRPSPRRGVVMARVFPRQAKGCARVDVAVGPRGDVERTSTSGCLELTDQMRLRHVWRVDPRGSQRIRVRVVYGGSTWNSRGSSGWSRLPAPVTR